MALLLASPLTTAWSANAWIAQGRAQGELKLPLLPFLLEHAMLPGETREIFVFDESLRACVTAAAAKYDNCIGGLLMNEGGRHYELVNLLSIHEVKVSSECTWVQLSCTGRCLASSLRKNKRYGYRVAVVTLYSDADDAVPGIDSLRALHGQVASQRRQLRQELVGDDQYDGGTWEALSREAQGPREAQLDVAPGIYVGQDQGRAPFGVYESYEAYEETGVLSDHVYVGQVWERPNALGCCFFSCRDLGELDDEENGAELDELAARRRAVLTSERGSDAHDESGDGTEGLGLLEAVGEAWNVRSEEQAQNVLLSFAAAATLSPMDRAQALMMRDTSQRLEFARDELANQQTLLTHLLEGTSTSAGFRSFGSGQGLGPGDDEP